MTHTWAHRIFGLEHEPLITNQELIKLISKKILHYHPISHRIIQWDINRAVNMDVFVLNILCDVPEMSRELYCTVIIKTFDLVSQKSIGDAVEVIFSKIDRAERNLNYIIEQHIPSE